MYFVEKMNDRLKRFLDYQGMSVRQFETTIGSSDGKIAKFLTSNSSLKSDTLNQIMENFPQLSIEWLLTGKGDMLKPSTSINDTNYTRPMPYTSGVAMTKKERLDAIISYYAEGKPTAFAKLIGVAPSTISSWLARDTYDHELLFAKCKDISPLWLLSGEGNMLKSTVDLSATQDNNPTLDADRHNMEEQYAASNEPKDTPYIAHKAHADIKRIPLVTQTAAAGFGNENFCILEKDVKDYYVVPKFRYHQVDFMIELSGSSMYPKYNSGDIVACTILHDRAFIQWNKCHIIATREQGLLCKRLMPGETPDTLKMISDNQNYPPFEVPKSDITGIALVIGVIRLE